MIHLGLIGYPLGHSLSPKIHAAALKACGLDGDYSLFPIEPDDEQGLKDLLDRVRDGEITGLNVTIPHKQNVIGLMDELTPTAKARQSGTDGTLGHQPALTFGGMNTGRSSHTHILI